MDIGNKCELDDCKICDGCRECLICDLDENKECDNCGKCIEISKNYEIIKIDKIISD